MDKKYKCFQVSVSNHVANLVLYRPDELNTMSRDFWVELGDVLEEINLDLVVINVENLKLNALKENLKENLDPNLKENLKEN